MTWCTYKKAFIKLQFKRNFVQKNNGSQYTIITWCHEYRVETQEQTERGREHGADRVGHALSNPEYTVHIVKTSTGTVQRNLNKKFIRKQFYSVDEIWPSG
jgi:hypothetical protein